MKLKKLIPTEYQINESTRSQIGLIDRNGNIVSTYVHFDGYKSGVGKTAKKYYSGGKVKQILKIDKGVGISSLGPKMDGGKGHSFDNQLKGQTVFYGRDRGEKGNMTSNWGNRDKVKFKSGEEYGYIYNLKDKKWYYKSRYSNPQDWTELK